MVDVWNREVNQLDLVLTYPGRGGMKQARYGIVIGTNSVYNTEQRILKTTQCYLIENMTEEQLQVKNALMLSYNKHTQKVVRSGGYQTIQPKIMHLYRGDSAVISYLYLGKYRLEIGSSNPKSTYSAKYIEGGHCYLKVIKGSRLENSILDFINKKVVTKKEFKKLMYMFCNMLYVTGGSYGYSIHVTNYELSNFVVSTRNRTFKEELGEIKLDIPFGINQEIFGSSSQEIEKIVNNRYIKFIPIK